MLRSAIAKASFGAKSRAASAVSLLRPFSLSAPTLAAAPPPKKQAKVVRKKEPKEKIKKGGMTHLKFSDAVRLLKYENLAADLRSHQVGELSAEKLAELDSKVVSYNKAAEQTLRGLGSFKKLQHHELFSSPVSMVTDNTKSINEQFIEKLEGASAQNRVCLLGEKGSGKSTLISQVQALTLLKYKNDVVLLHIDNAEKLVNGTSDYIFNPALNKYHQPMLTKRWIKQLRAANEDVFKKMPLTEDVEFVLKKVKHSLKKGENSLFDYVQLNNEFGFFGPSKAFQFFLQQLKAHSEKYPVLVSIDNFNSMIRKPHTAYFHSDMRPIALAEFEFGDFVSQLVSGDFTFKKGGLLISESKDCGECPTLKVGLGLQEPNPYATPEECDLEFAEKMTQNGGVKPMELANLSKAQSRELLAFLDNVGVLQIREYPTKEVYKSLEESAAVPGKTRNVGEFVRCEDRQSQFERILESSYFASAGNPGRFVKINSLTF